MYVPTKKCHIIVSPQGHVSQDARVKHQAEVIIMTQENAAILVDKGPQKALRFYLLFDLHLSFGLSRKRWGGWKKPLPSCGPLRTPLPPSDFPQVRHVDEARLLLIKASSQGFLRRRTDCLNMGVFP